MFGIRFSHLHSFSAPETDAGRKVKRSDRHVGSSPSEPITHGPEEAPVEREALGAGRAGAAAEGQRDPLPAGPGPIPGGGPPLNPKTPKTPKSPKTPKP